MNKDLTSIGLVIMLLMATFCYYYSPTIPDNNDIVGDQ